MPVDAVMGPATAVTDTTWLIGIAGRYLLGRHVYGGILVRVRE